MRSLRLCFAAWLCLIVVCTPGAHAQGDPEGAPADLPALRGRLELREPMPPRIERVWYGWQTLLADAVTGSFTIGLLATGAEAEPVLFALGTWGFATPVIHAAHGNFAHGIASLLARAGVVAASGLVATFIALAYFGEDDSPSTGVYLIAPALGAFGLAVVEGAILAYEERKVAPEPSAWQLTPIVGAKARALGLAVRGSF